MVAMVRYTRKDCGGDSSENLTENEVGENYQKNATREGTEERIICSKARQSDQSVTSSRPYCYCCFIVNEFCDRHRTLASAQMWEVPIHNVSPAKDNGFCHQKKTKRERTLVMLTSCPRCQHTFRAPCCGGGSPEASPSLPLTFILPTINPKPSVKADLSQTSDLDLQRISTTLRRLKSSGWFYEGITWQESMSLLASTKPGTFLVRESSDPRYLFSLSVQGLKGPVSVRIHYVNGYFRLDAEPALVPAIPYFDCVVKLVEYYISTSNNSRSCNTEHVFVDWTGHNYSHILLRKPLYQRTKFPSLKHLARLKINTILKNGETVPKLNIPVTLKDYLQEYAYTH